MLMISSGLPDPVFKIEKKQLFLQLQFITKTTLKIQVSLSNLSTYKVTLL